jgi:hypothetical protein
VERATGSGGVAGLGVTGEGLAEAAEGLALALEDLDLGLHKGRSPGQRDELGAELQLLLDVGVAVDEQGHLVGGLGTLLLVPGGLGAGLADEHVDLAELAVDRRDLGGEALLGGRCVSHAGESDRVSFAQSSGILIQPWRIAYTTAWVRSFTDSFRRIELMWFFTVCSLIERA